AAAVRDVLLRRLGRALGRRSERPGRRRRAATGLAERPGRRLLPARDPDVQLPAQRRQRRQLDERPLHLHAVQPPVRGPLGHPAHPVEQGNTPEYQLSSPDLQVVPRFALSETENSAQSLDVTFRLPTSDVINNQGEAAVTPYYNFWVNPWAGFVARGGVGFGIPFGNQSVNVLNARSTFLGNLALGYYFTPHDMIPFGDTVWYVSTN